MQGSYLALSSLQRKAAPGSDLNATSIGAFFFFVLILLLGCFLRVVSGGVVSGGLEVSTSKVCVAGLESTLPAASKARTLNTWSPLVRNTMSVF